MILRAEVTQTAPPVIPAETAIPLKTLILDRLFPEFSSALPSSTDYVLNREAIRQFQAIDQLLSILSVADLATILSELDFFDLATSDTEVSPEIYFEQQKTELWVQLCVAMELGLLSSAEVSALLAKLKQ